MNSTAKASLVTVYLFAVSFCSCGIVETPVGSAPADPSQPADQSPGPAGPMVFAGSSGSTMILESNGELWGTGANSKNELGLATTPAVYTFEHVMSDVNNVSIGLGDSMFVKNDHTLWAVGYNQYGRLGTGDMTDVTSPTQIMTGVESVSMGAYHTMIVKQDHTLWATGYNSTGEFANDSVSAYSLSPIQVMTGVSQVAAGYLYTMIVKTDGSLWGVGYNNYGELGDGTTTTRTSPVHIMDNVKSVSCTPLISGGLAYTLILKNDGTVWASGANSIANPSLAAGTAFTTTPVQILSSAKYVFAGLTQAQMIKNDDSLWFAGLCFDTTLPGIPYGTGLVILNPAAQVETNVSGAASSFESTTYIKKDGTIWAVGKNTYGQFGNGTTTLSSVPVQVFLP